MVCTKVGELLMQEIMRGYDMEYVPLRRKGQFLTLEVPGLAERRPSLMYGDSVFAKIASEDENDATRPYQASSCFSSSLFIHQ